jgi:uncharacterized membrane protein
MFGLFKPKSPLSKTDNEKILSAIRAMESRTSGEIRVFMEARNPMVQTMDRAQEIFLRERMHETKQRNAVLLYLAWKDRELALLGDAGIHDMVGTSFWQQQVAQIITEFKSTDWVDGIVHCIHNVGEVLAEKFPFDPNTDKNELSDEILLG